MREVFIPDHLDEVWGILERDPEAMLYAGGTDLLVKQRALKPLEPLAKNCNSVLAGQTFFPVTRYASRDTGVNEIRGLL